MGENENKMVHNFIVSDRSPSGLWFINLPVGIFEENKGNKWIDAVCFPNLIERYPDSYQENNDMTDLIDVDPHPENVTRSELFRRLIKLKDFSGEAAIIYEFKTGNQSLFKGIGQLRVYEHWFEQEWGSQVRDKMLVTEHRDYLIDQAIIHSDIQIKHHEA